MDMDDEESAIVARFLSSRHFEAGDFIFYEGDTGRSMYLLSRGSADVSIPIPEEGRRRRLATFAEGTIFGEMALLDGLPRAAGVQASGPLEVFELSHESFEELSTAHPQIAVKIQATIGRILGARLRGANALILELDS